MFMSRMLKGLAMVGALVAAGAAAQGAEDGIKRWNDVSMDMAKRIAEATLAECRSKGFNTAAVVVDRAGDVLVMLRDEDATPQTAELARRKAYTARMFRSSTMDWAKRTETDKTLTPQRELHDVIALGGGVPIRLGEEVIGAVGSAGSSQPQDDACARAGVAAFPNLNPQNTAKGG
jgi:uncharacterized protein GlcG (DUF336 family)